MRNPWSTNPEYIVRLTEQVVGKSALEQIIKRNERACNPAVLHLHLSGIIYGRVVKMNDATLGRICAYATSVGVHSGKHSPGVEKPRFINRSGLEDVLTPSVGAWFSVSRKRAPGEFLVAIAMAVISCVVVDIIFQTKWQGDWDTMVLTLGDQRQLAEKAERDIGY